MEELNKLMIEKGYKPILVFKFGVSNVSRQVAQQMVATRHQELEYLKDKYDVIILLDAKTNLYEESVEILNPFFKKEGKNYE